MILVLFHCWLRFYELVRLIVQISIIISRAIYRRWVPRPRKSIIGELVLITGGASGVGRQLALHFARLGAVVVIWDKDKEKLTNTVNEIQESVGCTTVYGNQVDVSSEKQVRQAVSKMRAELGDVFMVINNAGILNCKPFRNLTPEQIRKTYEINTLGHYWTCMHLLPQMEELGRGHIVAMASSASLMGGPYFTDYAGSKHAILGFMKSLQEEYASKPFIKFTTICPLGISDTGMSVPTHSRFHRILPIMTADYVAKRSVDAILRDQEMLMLPPGFSKLVRIMRNLPTKVNRCIFEYLDYAVDFQPQNGALSNHEA